MTDAATTLKPATLVPEARRMAFLPALFSPALMLIGVVGFLAFFRFGPFSPFLEGHFGFYGDRDVLLAVACLVLVLVGAGGASLDARIRKGRQEAKLHPDE